MSCCGDNFIVPGANPANSSSGVDSVGAGTPNVTITGTDKNPLVNVTNLGGVTQVEGQIGNINLNGVGITVVGGSPNPGDITLTADVQTITGSGGGIVVTQPTPGNYNLAVTANLVNNITQGAGITLTQPIPGTFNIASVVQNVTGSGGATVTQPTAGNFQVAVPLGVQNITASGGGVTVTQPVAGTFNVAVPVSIQNIFGGGHNSYPNAGGIYTVTSPDNSVNIDVITTANTMKLTVPAVNVGVESINTFTGNISLLGSGNTTIYNTSPSTITIGSQAVTSISPGTNVDGVTLASANSTITITNPSPGIIDFSIPNSDTTDVFGFTVNTTLPTGTARYYFVPNQSLKMNDLNYTVVTSINTPQLTSDNRNVEVTKSLEYVDFKARRGGLTLISVPIDVMVYTKNFTRLTQVTKTFIFTPPYDVDDGFYTINPALNGQTQFISTLVTFPPDYNTLYNPTVSTTLGVAGQIQFNSDDAHPTDTNGARVGISVNSGSPTEVPITSAYSGTVQVAVFGGQNDFTTTQVFANLALDPTVTLAYTFRLDSPAPAYIPNYFWDTAGMQFKFDYIDYI